VIRDKATGIGLFDLEIEYGHETQVSTPSAHFNPQSRDWWPASKVMYWYRM